MKFKALIFLFAALTALSSCNSREKHTAAPLPIRFDGEWKRIQSAKDKQEETVAVSKFIDAVYDVKRADSTGIKYALYYSYQDIKGQRRNLSGLFEKNAKDSLKTILIQIAPTIGDRILTRQTYKDWNPKDLNNLRYLMDR